MGSLLQQFLKPLIKPLTRFIVGVLAIPLFRMFMRRVVRMQVLDAELEKDLEQWFRASLVLLVATANMEMVLFGWLYTSPESAKRPGLVASVEPRENSDDSYLSPDAINENGQMKKVSPMGVFLMGLRLLLAISVIEMMPDQELFSIIHPGPPKIKYDKSISFWSHLKKYSWPMTKGIVCQHLNRSSPVFAILCAIAPGKVGWFCYGMALFQYLIIGLVTSKDKALDALSEFDRQVAERRRALIEEFEYLDESGALSGGWRESVAVFSRR
ncbi:MAG TPA: hypothetical protein VLA12_01305, partial [Planctomycetaceae bacterium]|nr:hypothetical protein [Planctomycetaceae bacterium]